MFRRDVEQPDRMVSIATGGGVAPLELWGGPECTVNRVGDGYRDQTRLTGHHDRLDDLALFADLGITRLRYPVLWERVAPDAPGDHDWQWSDERLAEIGRLGMQPIVGLLHHGSGPRYTSLVSDNFVELFTAYAAAAAQRYPHVRDWTPINEPLTTARFSTLYGFWYPHARDDRAFWTAMLNQVDATRGAMKAIRAINPTAKLIQTEDLGHFYATPQLAGVAERYNMRRWLTWDLLTGRVDQAHALWPDLERWGFGDRARAILDDPSPPDVIGVNYYVTSERFLDDRLDAYPFGRPEEGYHDLNAVRVLDPPPVGLGELLRQAARRYSLPVAITEAHLGCTREEQMRWVWQAWQTCHELKSEGVDIRAMTAWALLGNVDWNSLIVDEAGHYEPGTFDVSSGRPRATALAAILKRCTGRPLHQLERSSLHLMHEPGWWQREVRLEHPAFAWSKAAPSRSRPDGRPILITGATGTLGRSLAGACHLRGLTFVVTDRAAMNIADPGQVGRVLDDLAPWAVVNAAGWVRVDDAEEQEAACMAANAEGAALLASACAERGIHYTAFSSDLVFDGEQPGGYVEDDSPRPLNVYGRSKAAAEEDCLVANPASLIIRTAAFFSPYDPHNFAMHVERELRASRPVPASDDHVVTPAFVPDLVNATLDLVVDGERGIWHLSSGAAMSWYQFGSRIADAFVLDSALLTRATPAELGWRAVRPRHVPLRSTRGQPMPNFDSALARHVATRWAESGSAVSRKAVMASDPQTGGTAGAGEGIRTLDPDLGKVVLYP